MRKEEVKYASKDYVNYLLDKQEYHNEKYTEHDIKQAFEEGTQWADEHPNINSLWHTPDEIPQYNKRLVIHCDEKIEWNPINNTILYKDSEYPWKEIVELYNILHWAYAKDLVPNFNEEL